MDTLTDPKSLRERLRDTERDLQKYQTEFVLLQAETERLKNLFEYAPDGYYLIDFSGNFVDGNKNAADITGYDRNELVGKNLFDLNLLPAEQLPLAVKLFEQNLRGKPTGPDTFTLNRKDGSTVQIEICTYPFTHDGNAVVLGLARDISERIQAQEALVESERRFRTVVDESPIGIAIYNEHCLPLHANQKFMALFGIRSLSDIGHISLLDDVKISAEEKKKLLVSKTTHFEKVFDFDALGKRKVFQSSRTGRCCIEVQISPFGTVEGHTPGGFLLHAQDITERKTNEEKLRAARDSLEMEVRLRTASLQEANAALEVLIDEGKKRASALRETNTALKILLDERRAEKKSFKAEMLFNIRELALPLIEQLTTSNLSANQRHIVGALKSTLDNIMTPLVKASALENLPLTRSELHVANLIKQGMSTREIAQLFNASPRTIERHRDNLRKKLGLTNKKQNLRSYLLSVHSSDDEDISI